MDSPEDSNTLADKRATYGVEVGGEDGDVGGRAEEDEGNKDEYIADDGDNPGREDFVSEVAI